MTNAETNVAEKINDLLQRVANLKTADQLKPIHFNAHGEAHARRIAEADEVVAKRPYPPRRSGTRKGCQTALGVSFKALFHMKTRLGG